MDAALYHGVVAHRRRRPVEHRLAYRVFSLLVDLDRLDAVDRACRWFSRNRFNLFSFFDRDHGDGSADLVSYTRKMLRTHGFSGSGRILLLCYPRILGYVFNPLSVYYCHDTDDRLEAVLYEVRNTFGGKHGYLIAADGSDVIRQKAAKRFHVSPFIDMAATYHFRLSRPGERLALAIREDDAEGPLLDATFAGRAEAVSDRALLSAFFRYPLMTVKVIAAIHFEAAKLFAKGMRLRPGITPSDPITLVRAPTVADAR
ncbi:MAG: DUF1365 domain-containing protein [Parvularculaceae bacterium]|jgi:hypothetical protein|nr:DUF1365 domain-containing protein [Parvularculaceae bacterium]